MQFPAKNKKKIRWVQIWIGWEKTAFLYYLLNHLVKIKDKPGEDLCLGKVFFHVGFSLAQNSDGQAGAGEGMPLNQLGRKTQLTTEAANLKGQKMKIRFSSASMKKNPTLFTRPATRKMEIN